MAQQDKRRAFIFGATRIRGAANHGQEHSFSAEIVQVFNRNNHFTSTVKSIGRPPSVNFASYRFVAESEER